LDLTVIHATERGVPKGRKPIEWKLITDLPARTRSEALSITHISGETEFKTDLDIC
jgi:hypothetical protein